MVIFCIVIALIATFVLITAIEAGEAEETGCARFNGTNKRGVIMQTKYRELLNNYSLDFNMLRDDETRNC